MRTMRRVVLALYVLLTLASAIPALAAVPGATLPFTREQNSDGARWVWFIYQQAKFDYDYACTMDFPASPRFGRVDAAQVGDVAWWPDFMAIVEIKDGERWYMTAEERIEGAALEASLGQPLFFRYIVPAKKPG
jgi:hypothetical protein